MIRFFSACSVAAVMVFLILALSAKAQDNYEIQVYPYETVPPGHTMVELHTNLTVDGSKTLEDGMYPTEHAWHETLEITRGVTPWFEVGLYTFTSARSGQGWQWVGEHIRPRFRIPENWHWPVGVSLSQELGYQRRSFSADTWTWEIRPIIDKQIGRWYLDFNPSVDRSWHGENVHQGLVFSPNFKLGFDITKKVNAGFEYYGALGPLVLFDPVSGQQHQLFPVIDLNLAPQWEVNFGVGVGMTRSTDHLLVKLILGYRFNF